MSQNVEFSPAGWCSQLATPQQRRDIVLPMPHQRTVWGSEEGFFCLSLLWMAQCWGGKKTKPKETGDLFGWRQRGTAYSQTYYARDNEGCAYTIWFSTSIIISHSCWGWEKDFCLVLLSESNQVVCHTQCHPCFQRTPKQVHERFTQLAEPRLWMEESWAKPDGQGSRHGW